jgi:hypothetical protein
LNQDLELREKAQLHFKLISSPASTMNKKVKIKKEIKKSKVKFLSKPRIKLDDQISNAVKNCRGVVDECYEVISEDCR